MAVLRFFQDIYAETTKKPFIHPDSKPADSNISVQKLGKKFSFIIIKNEIRERNS